LEGVDLLYGIADAIYSFMESGPPMPAAFLYIAVGSVPVTLLHELGHAIAARRLLGSEVEVSVGNAGKIAQVRLGQIDATINVVSQPGRAAGVATFDASRATAEQVLWIALAGPLASLAGVVLATALLSVAPETDIAQGLLWAAVLVGVVGTLNIIPLEFEERRDGPAVQTDGRVALDALKVSRDLR
jgi:hypothetical protein